MLVVRIALKLILLCYSSQLVASTIIGKVNGESISSDELKAELESSETNAATLNLEARATAEKAALDKIISFRLAVQSAKKSHLDKNPQVKREIDKILYKAYLDELLRSAKIDLDPTDQQLQKSYEARPLLRLRHMVLFNKTPEQKAETEKTLGIVKEKLAKGGDFKDLVIAYNQDPSAPPAGDLDFRGPFNLNQIFYEKALLLKQNEVSVPIETKDGVHLIQMVERQPFTAIPSTYQEYLRNQIRSERSNTYLATLLGDLKKKAKVKIYLESKGAR